MYLNSAKCYHYRHCPRCPLASQSSLVLSTSSSSPSAAWTSFCSTLWSLYRCHCCCPVQHCGHYTVVTVVVLFNTVVIIPLSLLLSCSTLWSLYRCHCCCPVQHCGHYTVVTVVVLFNTVVIIPLSLLLSPMGLARS